MSLLSFFAHRSRLRALRLYDDAWRRVQDREYDAALKIARKLRKVRFSGAYEIEGRVYQARDQDEDAVRVLREGVGIAPSVWINWLLLGSSLSNLGRFEEALDAYDHAAGCERADLDNIELNRAVIAFRQEDYERTLHHLDQIHKHEDEDARLKAVALRVSALHRIDRVQESEALGARMLREWRNTDETHGKEDIGEIALVLGRIRWKRGENTMLLRSQAIDWWRATHHDRLLWLILELRPVRSPDAQYFRLVLNATISPDSAHSGLGTGFFKVTEVVADTAEEARSLYIELDPPEAGVELEIHEANVVEARPDEIKGVYCAKMGRMFYTE